MLSTPASVFEKKNEISQYFPKNSKGNLRNHWTNARLVCGYVNAFSLLTPEMDPWDILKYPNWALFAFTCGFTDLAIGHKHFMIWGLWIQTVLSSEFWARYFIPSIFTLSGHGHPSIWFHLVPPQHLLIWLKLKLLKKYPIESI